MSTKRTNKKMLAARILCTLLLGTYLTGGYGEQVAWGAANEGTAKVAGVENDFHGIVASAWGAGTKAYGRNSTSFGANTVADGHGATAFGGSSMALGFCNTAWGYATQAGQLLYGSDKKVAYIVDYKEGETTKYKIVDYNSEEKKTLKDGFNSYWDAYSECEVKDVDQATAWGSGAKATDWHATAFGFETIASGKRATAFGQKSEASGESATAWGGYFDGNVYKGGTASGTASTAFGIETAASGDASTAFGIYTEATGKGAVAWGVGEKGVGITLAHGESSTAFGKKSLAFGDNSLAALGGITGVGSIASIDGVTWVNFVPGTGEGAVAIGEGATAEASYTYAIGKNAKVLDAKTENAIAIGNDTSVTAVGGVALGSEAVASVDKGVAGYDPATNAASTDTTATWKSTHAALSIGKADGSVTRQITGVAAGSEDTDAVNVAQLKALDEKKLDKAEFTEYKKETAATLSLMQKATDNLADTKANVALDNISEDGKTVVRDLAKESVKVIAGTNTTVTEGTDGNAKTYAVDVVTDGAVASGDTGIVTGGTVYSEVRPASDGTYVKTANTTAANLAALDTQVDQNAKDIKANTDAIGTTADGNYVKASNSVGENLGALDTQVAALAGATGADMAALGTRVSNLDGKVEKVGAGAAALAALHPLDTDSKFTMGAGFGNYRSENAMALGMFYRPNDQVMFSMGGSLGNGENMINAGVSFALDKGVSTSKAAMARTIKAQGEKISEQDAKIQTLEAENAKLAERLAAIEAKLAK